MPNYLDENGFNNFCSRLKTAINKRVDTITTAEINALFGYSITVSITNGTYSGDTFIYTGNTANVTLTASTGYVLPSSIIVSGASYNYTNGTVVIYNPTSNVTVTVVCGTAPAGYTLTLNHNVNLYFGGDDGSCKIKIGSAPSSEDDYDYIATASGGSGSLIEVERDKVMTSDVVLNNVSTVYLWKYGISGQVYYKINNGTANYFDNDGYTNAVAITLSENTTLSFQVEIED